MSKPSPESTGPCRSLLVALVVTLALAGLLGALVLLTGGDDTSAGTGSADDVAPIATEAAPVETAAPTTQPPTTTSTTTTTTTSTTTTTIAPTTTVATPMFPMLPDGSPEPILAIYDGPTIRVSGWVPSQEKADQLIALALANSTDPNAVIEGELQIDPLVPLNIGTRVIEMNSPRFGPGSSEVTPEHALQLDRVANVMKLLPNVTATVVGHADQLGDESANYALSEARAVSVVRYLVGQGVEPARLAARAVGEQDLLSEDDSDAALALNRRTEFIFYGLIAD
jgi:outer membrane protein OmpA-like peptidoglycan-associated protein